MAGRKVVFFGYDKEEMKRTVLVLVSSLFCLAHAVGQTPVSSERLLSLAVEHMQKKELRVAEDLTRRAIAAVPQSAQAHNLLGMILSVQNRYTEAVSEYREALRLDASLDAVYFNLARLETGLGNYVQAIELLQGRSSAPDVEPLLQQFLAELYLMTHQKQQAVKISRAMESNPRTTLGDRLELGKLFARNRQYRTAIDILERTKLHYPDSYETLMALGLAHLAQGDTRQAESILAQATGLRPEAVEPVRALAFLLAQQDEHRRANSYFEKVVELKPDSFDAHFDLAASHILVKNNEAAIRELQKAVVVDPSRAQAFYHLGSLYFEGQDYAAAVLNYEQARELTPNDVNVLQGLLRSYYAAGRTDTGRTLLHQLKDVAPENAELHTELGILFTHERDFDEAQRQFGRARRGGGDSYRLTFNEARMNFLAGRFARAVEILDTVPESQRQGDYHNLLGLCSQKLHRFDEALSEFSQAIKIDPQNQVFYLNLGGFLLEVGSNDAALQVFSRARELFPHSPKCLLALGKAYRAKVNYKEAKQQVQHAIELDSENEDAYVVLGNLHVETGEFADAEASFRGAIALRPGLAIPYFLLAGAILEQDPLSPEAEALLEKALVLDASLAEPYYLLGRIRERHGDYPEAARLLVKAVALDPDLKKALYRLTQIYQRLGETDKAKKHFAAFRRLEAEEKRKRQPRALSSFWWIPPDYVPFWEQQER